MNNTIKETSQSLSNDLFLRSLLQNYKQFNRRNMKSIKHISSLVKRQEALIKSYLESTAYKNIQKLAKTLSSDKTINGLKLNLAHALSIQELPQSAMVSIKSLIKRY